MATEAKIRANLASIPDVTTIIIAQRITSVMDADRIVVIDDGRVHGTGTHAELMERDNIYQEIYASQMEFAEDAPAGAVAAAPVQDAVRSKGGEADA